MAYHAAKLVAERLEAAGRAAELSGVMRDVLAAVIELLPRRWSRVRDDRVQLAQVVELCESSPHHRTVGRALAGLDRLGLIHYTAAQGRGRTATIAIRHSFLAGVTELERDDTGRVVVPFSGRRPYINQTNYPPTPRTETDPPHQTRPTAVEVNPHEVRAVLADLPAPFQTLPAPLRWRLGRAVCDKLARGWRPTDVLDVLGAPIPAVVHRPLPLATWRLTKNMLGSGPRLAPLQRAYERQAADGQRRQDETALERSYQRVCAVTTAAQRAAMVEAISDMLGAGPDPCRSVITAARRAQREHPDAMLPAAIAAWLGEHRDRPQHHRSAATPAATNARSEALHWLSTAGGCVSCGGPGTPRSALPLGSVVCDRCWATHAEAS